MNQRLCKRNCRLKGGSSSSKQQ